MKKNGINLNKISKLVVLTLENAIRLHFDSILLFENESYPSAYFLSILALEELGKVTLLENFIYHSKTSLAYSKREDQQEYLDSIFKHQLKQRVFARHAEDFVPEKILADFRSGKIEILKQNAVYVGIERTKRKTNLKGMTISPYQVGMKKSRQQITIANDFLLCITLGTIKEIYALDTEGVELMLDSDLLSELTDKWKFKSRKASNIIKQWQSID